MSYNLSTLYLTPLLYSEIGVDPINLDEIVNTYMFDEYTNSEIENKFYIVHDFKNTSEYLSYEHQLVTSSYFDKSIDLDEKVVYVFKFPEKYNSDYLNFKNSKYSQFSKDAKWTILQSFTKIYEKSLKVNINKLMNVKYILNKDERYRLELEKSLNVRINSNHELGEYVDLNKETLKIDSLNELTTI